MAKRLPSASAAKAATAERDFTKYADKAPSDLQSRFSAWILAVSGYEPEDVDSFNEGVRLATALRMAFQASPENQEILEANRIASEEKRARVNAKPAAAPKKKPRKAEAEVTAPEDEDAEEVEDDEEENDAALRAENEGSVEDDPNVEEDVEVEEVAPAPRKPGKRVKRPAEVEDDDSAEAPF